MDPTTLGYRLVIFDFDGTLVGTASGYTFPQGVADRVWLPGRLQTIGALKAIGTKIAVATNQGGAAFGRFRPMDFDQIMGQYAAEARLDGYVACYFHPHGTVAELATDSWHRKPNPGMLQDLMAQFHITQEETVYVGDREEDREAARRAQINFYWADEFFAEAVPQW